MRTIAVLILMTTAAMAQGIPDAPSATRPTRKNAARAANPFTAPFKDPAFYIGTAEFAASAIADVHSTTECEHTNPPQCVEAYKGHDRYSYIAPQIVWMAGVNYACSLMLHDHRRWRWACLAVPVALSIIHWKDSQTIYRNDPIARP